MCVRDEKEGIYLCTNGKEKGSTKFPGNGSMRLRQSLMWLLNLGFPRMMDDISSKPDQI